MSVLVGLFCEFSYNFYESLYILIKTRNFAKSQDYFIMSYRSIDTLSSCEELTEGDFCGFRSCTPSDARSESRSDVIVSLPVKQVLPGSIFSVSGLLYNTSEQLAINFISSTGKSCDVALHFNPRPLQNYIVRNSKISGSWGEEENYSQFASRYELFRGSHFNAEILITEQDFVISVNGKVFCSYKHRIPYKKINVVEITGDVLDVFLEQRQRDSFTQSNIENIPSLDMVQDHPKIPFLASISGGFNKNQIIHILGRIKMLPNSITINLQDNANIWPHPQIALHINPRFSQQGGKHIMCLNSWLHGKWQKEQRTDLTAKDLSPGRNLKITIEASSEAYLIFINDEFYSEFTYRCEPSSVKMINIFGDIKLEKVWIAKKTFN